MQALSHGAQLRQGTDSLGQIEARKIYGKLNNADLHTKPLRSSAFQHMAHKILGQPPPITHVTTPISDPITAEKVSPIDMDVTGQPHREAKRPQPDLPDDTPGVKRRRAHILRYITPPAVGLTTDMEALRSLCRMIRYTAAIVPVGGCVLIFCHFSRFTADAILPVTFHSDSSVPVDLLYPSNLTVYGVPGSLFSNRHVYRSEHWSLCRLRC